MTTPEVSKDSGADLESKKLKDADTLKKVDADISPKPPSALKTVAEQSATKAEQFQLDILGSKVDAQKIQKTVTEAEKAVHAFVDTLPNAGKEVANSAIAGVKGASFGVLTYGAMKLSQMLMNAGKASWYGIKIIGAGIQNGLHYLSFKKINKADPVEKPQYFTFASDIGNFMGAKGFALGGAVGGIGASADISGAIQKMFGNAPTAKEKKREAIHLPVSAELYQKIIADPNHTAIQGVGKAMHMDNAIIKSAVYIVWREMTGESDIFIRTKSNPADNNSTAYGPMQLTKSLASIYLTKYQSIFSAEEKAYLKKFIAQGEAMNHKEVDNDPVYGYGKKGEPYFYSTEGKRLYYQVALKIWKQHITKAEGNIAKALEIWRGKAHEQDNRYFQYLKGFMEKARG